MKTITKILCLAFCLVMVLCVLVACDSAKTTDVQDTDSETAEQNKVTKGNAPHKHEFGDWKTVTEATCTKMGFEQRVCNGCSETETKTIAVLGHDIVAHEGKDATCTTMGWVKYDTCKRCNYSTYKSISLVDHTYKDQVCTVCGNVYYSKGLAFELNSDGTYTVTGIGTCANSELYIPPTFEGAPVVGIAEGAFEGITDLTSVILPDSVKSIGASAFQGCTNLAKITLPDGITEIGALAFEGTKYYTTNSNWKNNVLYIGKHLIAAKPAITGTCTVKDGTLTIADSAFAGCNKLAGIVIPASVTNIGKQVFNDCSALASISVNAENAKYKSVDNCLIETEAKTLMFGCKNSIIPTDGSVTKIGAYAFYGCTGLTTLAIPENIESIGEYAFAACTSLTSISISATVTEITADAFYNSGKSLTAITVAEGNTKYHSADNCLIETESKTLILGCNTSVIPTDGSVTSIADNAFYGCEGLAAIAIPDSITSIGNSAFYGCNALTEIVIGNSVVSVGETAFALCSNVTSVTISDSVTTIGKQAFYGCLALKSLTLGENVATIGEYAFAECSALEALTIPASVTEIGNAAFQNCGKKLTAITVAEGNTKYHSAGNCLIETESKTLILGCNTSVIPTDGSVTSIADYAFYGCESLSEIAIPESVKSIGGFAFYGCTALTSITVSEGVTGIGYGAFLNTGYYSDTTKWESNVLYLGKHLIAANTTVAGDSKNKYEIKDGTKTIAEKAFYGCNKLKEIVIPASVTSINFAAFEGCSKLATLTVPFVGDGAENTHFGYIFGASEAEENEFFVPSSLKTLTVTGGTTVAAYAFYGCGNLTTVSIPESVTSIGLGAFEACDKLATITLPFIGETKDGAENTHFGYVFGAALYQDNGAYVPASLKSVKILGGTKVADNAFDNCATVESIELPDGITSIGAYAFKNCAALQTMMLFDGLTSIGEGAFWYCGLMKSIIIPESVTSIGEFAFAKCGDAITKIENNKEIAAREFTVNFKGTQLQWNVIAKELVEIPTYTVIKYEYNA